MLNLYQIVLRILRIYATLFESKDISEVVSKSPAHRLFGENDLTLNTIIRPSKEHATMLPSDTVCSIDYNRNITGKVGTVIASKG